MDRRDLFAKTLEQVRSLTAGEQDPISLMATISCELFQEIPHYHWVGFYRNVGKQTLKIGPYQGTHGCLVIPFSRGVCGRCARTGEIQLVGDVLQDTEHIACSSSTRSELVLPVLQADGQLLGVLDVDSDESHAFGEEDVEFLRQIVDLFVKRIEAGNP